MTDLKRYKKHPLTPLFTDEKEVDMFISLFNDFDKKEHIEVAKELFVNGKTNLETAETTNYCVRQIERLKFEILRVALKRAVEKLVDRSEVKCKKKFFLF